MNVHGKNAREILEEIDRLEEKATRAAVLGDRNLSFELVNEQLALMKTYIENLHPGDYSFFMF